MTYHRKAMPGKLRNAALLQRRPQAALNQGSCTRAHASKAETKREAQDGGARPKSASVNSVCSDLCSDLTCTAPHCILAWSGHARRI